LISLFIKLLLPEPVNAQTDTRTRASVMLSCCCSVLLQIYSL